jgi:hypothetical protein
VPFIHAVYPNARFLLLVRDGRHVLLSADEQRRRSVRWDRILQRLGEVRLRELPAFLERLPWLTSRLCRGGATYWGTRPPGWRDWARQETPEVAAAKQWAATITKALDDLETIDPTRVARVRYEDLLVTPRKTIERVRDVLALQDIGPVVSYLDHTADPAREARRREQIRGESTEAIRLHIEPALRRLGYEW